MDDKNEVPRTPGDPARINVNDPFEVRRWCQRFVCTEAALRAAVIAVGTNPAKVRRLVALDGDPSGPPSVTRSS
jgi:hypothetical protein